MVMSTVFPILIRLNHMINPVTKINSLNYCRYAMKPLYPVKLRKLNCRLMSSKMDKDLNDPKRHFDYDQLNVKMKEGNVVIIDVRDHSEINETGKIPSSIHIPLAELQKALGNMTNEEFKKSYFSDKPKKTDEIIFSCKAGGRSLKALKLGLELGYNKAGNYKGGWLDWSEKSKPN